jgi:hypothetical protein
MFGRGIIDIANMTRMKTINQFSSLCAPIDDMSEQGWRTNTEIRTRKGDRQFSLIVKLSDFESPISVFEKKQLSNYSGAGWAVCCAWFARVGELK